MIFAPLGERNNPGVSNLGSVPGCGERAVNSPALRCVGVSCCQSNLDFVYCPGAMQKTDSERVRSTTTGSITWHLLKPLGILECARVA